MLFKETKRTSNSFEAFTLLAQYHFLLSPRAAMQLIWNRTINVHGYAGRNVSCDLHMEHLNREAKNGICSVESNTTDETVKRVGRSIGCTVEILNNFDTINSIKQPSGRHSKHSTTLDMKIILKQLHEEGAVFHEVPGRVHRSFLKFESNPIQFLTVPQLTQWMEVKLQKLIIYNLHAKL